MEDFFPINQFNYLFFSKVYTRLVLCRCILVLILLGLQFLVFLNCILAVWNDLVSLGLE